MMDVTNCLQHRSHDVHHFNRVCDNNANGPQTRLAFLGGALIVNAELNDTLLLPL